MLKLNCRNKHERNRKFVENISFHDHSVKFNVMQNSTNILYLLHQDDGSTLPISVAVGDKVLLPEYGGTKVNIEDQVLSCPLV